MAAPQAAAAADIVVACNYKHVAVVVVVGNWLPLVVELNVRYAAQVQGTNVYRDALPMPALMLAMQRRQQRQQQCE